jgi:hypothetical protein
MLHPRQEYLAGFVFFYSDDDIALKWIYDPAAVSTLHPRSPNTSKITRLLAFVDVHPAQVTKAVNVDI